MFALFYSVFLVTMYPLQGERENQYSQTFAFACLNSSVDSFLKCLFQRSGNWLDPFQWSAQKAQPLTMKDV